MGRPKAKISSEARTLSSFISSMPMVENPKDWGKLFDIYNDYLEAGGCDPKMIRLFEMQIEQQFKPVRVQSEIQKNMIEACESYLDAPRSKPVKRRGKPLELKRDDDESQDDFAKRRSWVNSLASDLEVGNKLKKTTKTKSKALLNSSIKRLAENLGFAAVPKLNKDVVTGWLDKARSRPLITKTEGEWVWETLLKCVPYAGIKKVKGKRKPRLMSIEKKTLIAGKAFIAMMNAEKPYDPDASKGERIQFIEGACKNAFSDLYGKKGPETKAVKVSEEIRSFARHWEKAPNFLKAAATGGGFNPKSLRRKKTT
jgi:hypothetical protein